MQVVKELEQSVELCSQCAQGHCQNNAHINAIDRSVAFFCGSLAGENGEKSGFLLYDLARKRHNQFHQEPHHMGDKIADNYRLGQSNLLEKNCNGARKQKDVIIGLLKVTLIQSVLRYAFVREQDNFEDDLEREKAVSLGVTYAAALLPFVHVCSENDAQIVHENMRVDAQDPSFVAVKSALERQYKCMGITCAEVGGVLIDGGFVQMASPCIDEYSLVPSEKEHDVKKRGPIIGCTATIVTLLSAWFIYKTRRIRRRHHYTPNSAGVNIAAVSDLA